MFETTLRKIGGGLYFFIPIKESLKLKRGKIINIQINNNPPFLKKLRSPQKYITQNGKKRLFQVTVPHAVISKYRLKNGKKIKITITINGKEK